MKLFILLLSYLTLLSACTKTDRTMLNKPCTDSCTTVQGRFITGNNEGIGNISYEIKSVIKPTLGLGQTIIRKIASGKTDNNGYYSSIFSLQQGEFGQGIFAPVYISFNLDTKKFLPVKWYEYYGTEENLGPFTRKDTTTTANIYLASKAKIKIRIEGFVPLQSGDAFSVITSCGAGLERRYTSGGYIQANQPITEGPIDACGNEQTTLIVRKQKNGVYTSSSTTIATPTGQTVAITFTY